jgi:hypothetical protein
MPNNKKEEMSLPLNAESTEGGASMKKIIFQKRSLEG